jgi:hypothetical protein
LKINAKTHEKYQAIVFDNTVWILEKEPTVTKAEYGRIVEVHKPVAYIEIEKENEGV